MKSLPRALLFVIQVLGCVVAVLTLVVLPVSISLSDRSSRRTVREYCEKHGIDVMEIKTWKNAYGVYFRANGKRKYSRSIVVGWGKKRVLEWEGKSPLETLAEAREPNGNDQV